MKKLIIPKQIVTVNKLDAILKNHALLIEDDKISGILGKNEIELSAFEGEIYEYPELTLIPGFIQTHIHLCQTLFRGLADDLELLDWLQLKIFPYENAHNQASLKISAQLGINELQLGGTTTILDMGTIRHQEVIFEELINSGMRAFAGKCMVDKNGLMPQFKESTDESLNSSYELAKHYHNKTKKIKYGFAPRFVLSCSERLLRDTHDMLQEFNGSLYHTHSSENRSEIEEVRKMTGKENIEYFNQIGILGNSTVLAHCIHLNELEIGTLKSTGSRVSHCVSSNLKLGSGIANIPQYIQNGISVSLGADGAPCNNNLSIFHEMRLASLIQKPLHGPTSMDAKTTFRLSNIEGAKALNLENEIGSIEVGKQADLVLIDLERPSNPLNDSEEKIYSSIVYSSERIDVKHVMIGGQWVARNGKSLHYDENELLSLGKKELKSLLNRVD
ncbi:MAG: N-ethylammeline chlorohydrolase [Ignavibacteriae bacterium HGW-Ignavibacteriae-2]|jgi:cytosine/adenosine deaminase-related metal-dependent hydrolase|nr:MAG: N-ethylammeline chlorohydrolase [Ignavibacteriae bacterium HGW-Ignavibacteriae-2]